MVFNSSIYRFQMSQFDRNRDEKERKNELKRIPFGVVVNRLFEIFNDSIEKFLNESKRRFYLFRIEEQRRTNE